MKKKLLNLFAVIILAILFGYLNTLFTFEGIWSHFFKTLGTSSIYFHILYGFLALFLVILMHELGHAVTFIKYGIKIKAIYVLCFAFVNDNGWKIRFNFRFLLMLGGIVIPDLVIVDSQSKEDEVVNIFKKVLLAGPNTSIIYGIVIFLMWFISLFTSLYGLSGFLFTLMLVTSIMTLLVVLSSKVSRPGIYGDYAAIKAFDNDSIFKLTYLLQLTSLIKRDQNSLTYLWKKVVETLENNGYYSHKMYPNLLQHYVYETTFEDAIGCTSINLKIDKLMNRLPLNSDGYALYFQMMYYYASNNDFSKVYQLINDEKFDRFEVDKQVQLYQLKLTNHLLGFKDESSWLLQEKNQITSTMDWVYKPLKLKFEIKEIRK